MRSNILASGEQSFSEIGLKFINFEVLQTVEDANL